MFLFVFGQHGAKLYQKRNLGVGGARQGCQCKQQTYKASSRVYTIIDGASFA
jgi:hypothetical protein